MKLICAAVVFAVHLAAAQTNPAPASVELSFSYPAAETHSNLSFKVWTAPSLSIPLTNWLIVTQFVSIDTNLFLLDGTNSAYHFRVPVYHGAQFWTATATDAFWGESIFSNFVATNPLPRTAVPFRIAR